MKFIFTLLLTLFWATHALAQMPALNDGPKGRPAINKNKQELIISPLKMIKENSTAYKQAGSSLNKKVSKFSLISLADNYAQLQRQVAHSDNFILQVPVSATETVQLNMQKNRITTPDFFVRTSEGKIIEDVKGIDNHFTAAGVGKEKYISALSFNSSGITGFISNKNGNNIIEQLTGNKTGVHILYNDAAVMEKPVFTCHTAEGKSLKNIIQEQRGHSPQNNITCKTVKIYIECSYAMYLANNSNVNDVIDFVFSLFNSSAALFKNDGINIQVSELYIWTKPDIYTGITFTGSIANALEAKLSRDFRDGRRINADIAHYITPQNLSGGAATGYGIINNCGKSNGILRCAASTAVGPFAALPSYSYSVYVFAHETGHMLGSQHTQSCSWPGGAIDNCAAPEGLCARGPAPVNGGTIMSYCNFSPYGINFSNGFGPLPAAFMRDHIESVSCVSLCQDTVCDIKLRGVQTTLTNTALKLKWINDAPKYKIGVKPNTTQQWQYYEVMNTDSFVLAKTYCESLYEYSITPFCPSLNKYAASYTAWAGDSLALLLKLNTNLFGNFNTVSLCAGNTLPIFVTPDSNVLYRWYLNGVLQPHLNSRAISATEFGNYQATASANGCDYYTDTMKVLRLQLNPRILGNIVGHNVNFRALTSLDCAKKYLWNFGDGTQDTLLNIIHSYDKKGIYPVSLKVWDAYGNMEEVQRTLTLLDEFIDSLNGFSRYGLSTSVEYTFSMCRNVAVFNADSLHKNFSSSFVGFTPGLRYGQNFSTNLFETPKTGTLEFKLYPKTGLIKLRGDNTVVQHSDTGYVLNATNSLSEQIFSLSFSKWGGILVTVDSIVLGNIANGIAGPLKLNKWNNIGISYGDKGIDVMVNGQMYVSDTHVIDSAHASLLGRFNFGSYPARFGSSLIYAKGFDGAIDLIRFSPKQKDFTFSSAAAWQGADTVVINKQVCYGGSYLGYTATGTYFRQAVTAAGCDSITRINLLVNGPVTIEDSLMHPLDGEAGNIFVKNISGAVLPLRYEWSTGDTTKDLLNVKPGKYNLLITDALGCKTTITNFLYQLDSKKDYIVLFPNPGAEGQQLMVRAGTVKAKKYIGMVYDVLGKKMHEQTININAGITEVAINKRLLKGVYILQLRSNNQKQSIRFIIH